MALGEFSGDVRSWRSNLAVLRVPHPLLGFFRAHFAPRIVRLRDDDMRFGQNPRPDSVVRSNIPGQDRCVLSPTHYRTLSNPKSEDDPGLVEEGCISPPLDCAEPLPSRPMPPFSSAQQTGNWARPSVAAFSRASADSGSWICSCASGFDASAWYGVGTRYATEVNKSYT